MMKRIMRIEDQLLIRSVGKTFRVTAIFTNIDEANVYMERHNEASCIAEFKPFIFIADRFDAGRKE